MPAGLAAGTDGSSGTVLSPPTDAEVIPGLPGTQLTLGVAKTANFAWDDCPDNPRCAAFFTHPTYWGSNSWAIAGDNVQELYLAPFRDGGSDHVFFVLLYGADRQGLERLRPRVEPILRELVLPIA